MDFKKNYEHDIFDSSTDQTGQKVKLTRKSIKKFLSKLIKPLRRDRCSDTGSKRRSRSRTETQNKRSEGCQLRFCFQPFRTHKQDLRSTWNKGVDTPTKKIDKKYRSRISSNIYENDSKNMDDKYLSEEFSLHMQDCNRNNSLDIQKDPISSTNDYGEVNPVAEEASGAIPSGNTSENNIPPAEDYCLKYGTQQEENDSVYFEGDEDDNCNNSVGTENQTASPECASSQLVEIIDELLPHIPALNEPTVALSFENSTNLQVPPEEDYLLKYGISEDITDDDLYFQSSCAESRCEPVSCGISGIFPLSLSPTDEESYLQSCFDRGNSMSDAFPKSTDRDSVFETTVSDTVKHIIDFFENPASCSTGLASLTHNAVQCCSQSIADEHSDDDVNNVETIEVNNQDVKTEIQSVEDKSTESKQSNYTIGYLDEKEILKDIPNDFVRSGASNEQENYSDDSQEKRTKKDEEKEEDDEGEEDEDEEEEDEEETNDSSDEEMVDHCQLSYESDDDKWCSNGTDINDMMYSQKVYRDVAEYISSEYNAIALNTSLSNLNSTAEEPSGIKEEDDANNANEDGNGYEDAKRRQEDKAKFEVESFHASRGSRFLKGDDLDSASNIDALTGIAGIIASEKNAVVERTSHLIGDNISVANLNSEDAVTKENLKEEPYIKTPPKETLALVNEDSKTNEDSTLTDTVSTLDNKSPSSIGVRATAKWGFSSAKGFLRSTVAKFHRQPSTNAMKKDTKNNEENKYADNKGQLENKQADKDDNVASEIIIQPKLKNVSTDSLNQDEESEEKEDQNSEGIESDDLSDSDTDDALLANECLDKTEVNVAEAVGLQTPCLPETLAENIPATRKEDFNSFQIKDTSHEKENGMTTLKEVTTQQKLSSAILTDEISQASRQNESAFGSFNSRKCSEMKGNTPNIGNIKSSNLSRRRSFEKHSSTSRVGSKSRGKGRESPIRSPSFPRMKSRPRQLPGSPGRSRLSSRSPQSLRSRSKTSREASLERRQVRSRSSSVQSRNSSTSSQTKHKRKEIIEKKTGSLNNEHDQQKRNVNLTTKGRYRSKSPPYSGHKKYIPPSDCPTPTSELVVMMREKATGHMSRLIQDHKNENQKPSEKNQKLIPKSHYSVKNNASSDKCYKEAIHKMKESGKNKGMTLNPVNKYIHISSKISKSIDSFGSLTPEMTSGSLSMFSDDASFDESDSELSPSETCQEGIGSPQEKEKDKETRDYMVTHPWLADIPVEPNKSFTPLQRKDSSTPTENKRINWKELRSKEKCHSPVAKNVSNKVNKEREGETEAQTPRNYISSLSARAKADMQSQMGDTHKENHATTNPSQKGVKVKLGKTNSWTNGNAVRNVKYTPQSSKFENRYKTYSQEKSENSYKKYIDDDNADRPFYHLFIDRNKQDTKGTNKYNTDKSRIKLGLKPSDKMKTNTQAKPGRIRSGDSINYKSKGNIARKSSETTFKRKTKSFGPAERKEIEQKPQQRRAPMRIKMDSGKQPVVVGHDGIVYDLNKQTPNKSEKSEDKFQLTSSTVSSKHSPPTISSDHESKISSPKPGELKTQRGKVSMFRARSINDRAVLVPTGANIEKIEKQGSPEGIQSFYMPNKIEKEKAKEEDPESCQNRGFTGWLSSWFYGKNESQTATGSQSVTGQLSPIENKSTFMGNKKTGREQQNAKRHNTLQERKRINTNRDTEDHSIMTEAAKESSAHKKVQEHKRYLTGGLVKGKITSNNSSAFRENSENAGRKPSGLNTTNNNRLRYNIKPENASRQEKKSCLAPPEPWRERAAQLKDKKLRIRYKIYSKEMADTERKRDKTIKSQFFSTTKIPVCNSLRRCSIDSDRSANCNNNNVDKAWLSQNNSNENNLPETSEEDKIIVRRITKSVEEGEMMSSTLGLLIEWNSICCLVLFLIFIGKACPRGLNKVMPCPVASLTCESTTARKTPPTSVTAKDHSASGSPPKVLLPTTPSSEQEQKQYTEKQAKASSKPAQSEYSILSKVIAWPFKALSSVLAYGISAVADVTALAANSTMCGFNGHYPLAPGEKKSRNGRRFPGVRQADQERIMRRDGGGKRTRALDLSSLENITESADLLFYLAFGGGDEEQQ